MTSLFHTSELVQIAFPDSEIQKRKIKKASQIKRPYMIYLCIWSNATHWDLITDIWKRANNTWQETVVQAVYSYLLQN